jgi:hypothetical protein
MNTYIENLTIDLDNIKTSILELLNNSRIIHKEKDNSYSRFVIVSPYNNWDIPNNIEKQIQIKLKKSYELSIKTKIDSKVCAMVCKKLSNNFYLHGPSSRNNYWLLDDETRKKEINNYNKNIDKYNLKFKKIII